MTQFPVPDHLQIVVRSTDCDFPEGDTKACYKANFNRPLSFDPNDNYELGLYQIYMRNTFAIIPEGAGVEWKDGEEEGVITIPRYRITDDDNLVKLIQSRLGGLITLRRDTVSNFNIMTIKKPDSYVQFIPPSFAKLLGFKSQPYVGKQVVLAESLHNLFLGFDVLFLYCNEIAKSVDGKNEERLLTTMSAEVAGDWHYWEVKRPVFSRLEVVSPKSLTFTVKNQFGETVEYLTPSENIAYFQFQLIRKPARFL